MKKIFGAATRNSKCGTGHSKRGMAIANRETKKIPPAMCAPPEIGEITDQKPPLVQQLESAIATRRKSQTELSDLGKLLAETSARQVALEKTGDLHNAAVITELGRLQIFTQLLPRRIAAQEEADARAEETLTQAANQFIQQHLGPRIRRLTARTRAIVEGELSSHFRDPSALIIAVAQSERVRKIESLDWAASLQPMRGAISHAEGALQAWLAADEFEKALPPES